MTEEQITFVKKCIDEDIHAFYVWQDWRILRRQVLKLDHNECQNCRKRGIYRRANTVHHINYVKRHPELALEIWCEDTGGKRKRNLISLCHDCHEAEHEYRKRKAAEPLTVERW